MDVVKPHGPPRRSRRAAVSAPAAPPFGDDYVTTVLRLDGTVATIRKDDGGEFLLTVEYGDRHAERLIAANVARDPMAAPEFVQIVAELKAELLHG